MKKILTAIMVCALVLSFAGLTMAAEEKKVEAKPAVTVTPAAPATPVTPAAPVAPTPVATVAPVAPATPAAPTPAAPVTPVTPAKSTLTPEDMKWIAQCIIDNKDEGQAMDVVQKYCECMNEKMDENETQSVTQWEKSHKKEQKECADKAGWK